MRKNSRICLWLLCAVLMYVTVAVAAVGTALPAQAATAVQLQEQYLIGEEISVPVFSFDTSDGSVSAAAFVHTPSGVTYKVQDRFVPTEGGLHELEYIGYDSAGKRYSNSYNFIVASELYSVGSARSSISFGKYQYANVTVDRAAVLASVVSTDKFSYSQIIDLNELDGQSFLEFFVTPEKIGTNDVGKINIVLTDLYNPENFVTITIKKGIAGQVGAAWAERTSYITANAAGQQPTGLERGKGTLEIDDNNYMLHKGDLWGANVAFALPGNPGYVSLEQPNNDPYKVASQTLAFRFDSKTSAVYANNQLVTMLSNEDIYGADIWTGFTTGQCLLTIEGSDYNAASLNLAITKLGQYTPKEFESVLRENVLADTQPPVVKVNVPESGCPKGVAGIAYPLFEAIAQDDYTQSVQAKAAVYLNYATGKQVQVDVKNGTFVPFAEGIYTIVYSAYDRYGNVGMQEIAVTVEPENSPYLQAKIDQPEEGKAGQNYTVPVPFFQNNHGDIFWEAVAAHENGKVSYAVTAENPVFFPEYAGNYTLTYTYCDYICSENVEKALVIQASDTPVFFEDPVLPKTLIYGCIYHLPQIDVRTYSTGEPVQATPAIYVIEDGEQEYKADYRFVSYAKETIQIIYRQENNGQTAEFRSAVLPVKNVGYNGTYQIGEYFDCDGFVTNIRAKSIRFTPAQEDTQSATASFINPLQTFDFSIRFAGAGRGFEKINLYLTDIADASVKLKFTYRLQKNAVYFSINDGEESRLAGVNFNDPSSPLALNVKNNGLTVMPTGTSALSHAVRQDAAGKPFAGFTDNKAYLTVEMTGVTRYKQAGVDIFNICGQIISGIYVDNIKPMLSAVAASGARPCGTEFTIPAVFYGDVLDPVPSCTMYVLAPDGSYATAKNGTVLDETSDPNISYVLPLLLHGNYTINYMVKDTAGNELVFSYLVTSADVIAPKVEILAPVTGGVVNTQIPVAEIRITDNNDTSPESFTVYTYVVTPEDQTFALMDTAMNKTNHFTASVAGVYTVGYMVMDSGGNMTVATYKVTVE